MTKLSVVFIICAIAVACSGEEILENNPAHIRLIQAAYSKNTNEINKITNEILNEKNLKAIIQELRQKLGHNFIHLSRELKSTIKSYLESNGHDLEVIENEIKNLQGGSREAAGNLNEIFGEEVLQIKEDNVVINYDNFENVLHNVFEYIVQDKLGNNLIMQVIARRNIRNYLTIYRPILRNIIENQSMSLVSRNKRSLVNLRVFDEIIMEVGKVTVQIILQLYNENVLEFINPIQNATLTGIEDFRYLLKGLYNREEPKDALGMILNHTVNLLVERLQEILQDTAHTLDTIFESIKSGEIDQLFYYIKYIINDEDTPIRQLRVAEVFDENDEENDEIAPSEPENNVSFMDWLWRQISRTINMLLKMYIKTILKVISNPVGSLVLEPVQVLLNYIVDLVFPLTG